MRCVRAWLVLRGSEGEPGEPRHHSDRVNTLRPEEQKRSETTHFYVSCLQLEATDVRLASIGVSS
jgi:hypothetical protein